MKRFLGWLLAVVIAASGIAYGQGCYTNKAMQVIAWYESPIPNATIRVCPSPSTGSTCMPLETGLFTDYGATKPLQNPFHAAVDGTYTFCVPTYATVDIQISSTSVPVFTIPAVNVGWRSGGGGTSNCGPLTNDSTSTLCGDNSLVGATGTSQSAFGYNDANANTARWVVTVGTNNGNNNTGEDNVLIGDSNLNQDTAPTGNFNDLIGIGDVNLCGIIASGQHTTDLIAIGDSSLCAESETPMTIKGSEVIAIGDSAGSPNVGSSYTINEAIFMGDGAGSNASGQDVIAIGDGAGSNHTGPTNNSDDLVSLGEGSGANNGDGSSDIIGIGNDSASNLGAASSDVVAIGHQAGAATYGTTLTDVVAIGDGAKTDTSHTVVIGSPTTTTLKLWGCPAGETVYDDGSGTCYTPGAGASGLSTLITPPTTGTYAILYPTTYTSASSPDGYTNVITGFPGSGYINRVHTGPLSTDHDIWINWAGFSLPSYISASSVTAVYAVAVSEGTKTLGNYLMSAGQGTPSFNASISFSGASWGFASAGSGQVNTLLASGGSASSFNYGITSISADNADTLGPSSGYDQWFINSVALVVFYSGTQVAQGTTVQVAPPLDYNTALNTLSILPASATTDGYLRHQDFATFSAGGTGALINGVPFCTGFTPVAGQAIEYFTSQSPNPCWGAATPSGSVGPTGPSGTIAIGTVTTGAAGSSATVTNSGSSTAATLNFSIPQGIQGVQGYTGATGSNGAAATIAVGTTTTSAPGTSASVTNSGSSSAATFNFTIPQGATGATGSTGPTGSTGSAATIALGSVATGTAGSNVVITNSGSSSAAIFNFTIPVGNTGNTGAAGATGSTGPMGPSGGSTNWRGTCNTTSNSYAALDACAYQGSSYVATTSVSTSGPMPPNSPWQLLAQAGSAGVAGAAGPNTVSTSTATNLTGFLTGNGSTVSAVSSVTEAQVANLTTDLSNKASAGITVNGHPLTANVTVSASDLNTGTVPHAQLPALVSTDIPNITESQVTNLTTDLATLTSGLAAKVSTTQTVNGHPLSSPVTVTAADIGVIPQSQVTGLTAALTALNQYVPTPPTSTTAPACSMGQYSVDTNYYYACCATNTWCRYIKDSWTASAGTVATPTLSPTFGSYSGSQTVTFSSTTPGAKICAILGAGTPAATTAGTCDSGSTTYANNSSVTISSTTVVSALATLAGYTNSSVTSGTYTITGGTSAGWSGILDPSRAVDWTSAGATIPTRSTNCATLSAGASASAINSAIASCTSGQVVYLNAGTYNLSSGIVFANKSNVTLRGAGANSTFLVFTGNTACGGPDADICVVNGETNWPGGVSNSANWTAGYAKGVTQITLSNTANLSVGSIIILDQLNDSSDSGAVYVCEDSSTGCVSEVPAGGERTNRAQQQLVTVTAINGNTVTISPGLYMPNWSSSKSPGAWWATTKVSGDGIENLSMDHSNSTNEQGGIIFFSATNSWVKGVRSLKSNRNHVWIDESAHITVRDSYFYGTQNAASQSYGIEAYISSDNLIENNMFQQVSSPVMLNGSASGTVVGYNFSIDDYYASSSSWFMGSDWIHAAGIDSVLFEGNNGAGLTADNIHGTHNFVTAFRNRFTGWETGKTQQTTPMNIYSGSRYFNIVGNVLGTSGYHDTYMDQAPGGSNYNTAIYDIGWGDGSSNDDSIVLPTLLRWGNYDTVNGSSRWIASEVPSGLSVYGNAVPSSQTLPASFYLSAKPGWWPGTKAWPSIGPDVTGGNITNVGGHAYTIPAADCYLTTMGGPASGTGSALSYNESSCYSQ